jgi:hypothetical protein
MDDELKAKLLTYLNEVEAAATTGKDFLIEQAPLYVQELIAWEFWSSVMATGCTLAVALAIGLFLRWWFPFSAKFQDTSYRDGTRIMFGIWGGAAIAGCLVMAVVSASCALKVSVAPRVVIVEKLHEALK